MPRKVELHQSRHQKGLMEQSRGHRAPEGLPDSGEEVGYDIEGARRQNVKCSQKSIRAALEENNQQSEEGSLSAPCSKLYPKIHPGARARRTHDSK